MTPQDLNIFAPRKKILKKAIAIADKADALKKKYAAMKNEDLSKMTAFFESEINNNNKTLDDIMPEAFAVAREAIYRVHGLFAFKVQLVGAAVIHFGDFAEMYTGEGKTLTLVLAAYLNAIPRKGIHVVTVNEYLVQRDAKFCAEALNPLGITVGYNISSLSQSEKKKMFGYDITYTTNSELGFDYLRDNMVRRYDEKVIRDLSFAIVDEADSVLIDEARTPLIISGQPKKDTTFYVDVDLFVKKLITEDYTIDPETNSASLSDKGVVKAQNHFRLKNLYDIQNSDLVHKIKNALMANFVFEVGVEYIVNEGKIKLIDQFTGRILEGRSYNAGLHQAIQAKEMVTIEPENVIVATITYQSFFRLYKKLSGLSGTALTEAEEFLKIYNMVVVPIPTNKKIVRKDLNDFVFENKISKWHHVVAEIERIHQTGQPILVGTASVEDSEDLVHYLKNKGLNFELLNAKNHAREAEIVSRAGQKGSITISTNMAGRGTDIKLGEGVRELGGLYVIGTERHESRRIDNQLRGRSGRQGDPGTTRFFISLQDTLFRRFAVEKSDKANDKIDDEYYDSWFFTRLLNSTQKKVEGLNFDMRKNLIDYDSVLSNQRELVYKQRDQILKNIDNTQIIKNMIKTVVEDIVNIFKDPLNQTKVNVENITKSLNEKLLGAKIINPSLFEDGSIEEAIRTTNELISASIDVRTNVLGKERANQIFRDVMIQNLDQQWTMHLDKMSKIREGVSLRSLEQRSPLNIYVEEADKNFIQLKKNVAHQTILAIHKIFIPRVNDEIKSVFKNVFNKTHIFEEERKEAKIIEQEIEKITPDISAKEKLLKQMKEAKNKDTIQ